MVTGNPAMWSPKPALVRGGVKPWHVLFLLALSWIVSGIGAHKIAEHAPIESRMMVRDMAIPAISASIILVFTLVVPEFRRALPSLFARPVEKPASGDLALAFAVMLAWGYALYQALVCLPMIYFLPELFRSLGYVSSVPQFQAEFVAFWAGAALVAPVAEELIFRGYLLNLWANKWSVWKAVIVSSMVFGLVHWDRAAFAAPMGFIFALVYLKYDSLWPGIFLHAVYNALASPWTLGRFSFVKQQVSTDQYMQWMPEIVISVVSVPLLILFWRRFKPITA